MGLVAGCGQALVMMGRTLLIFATVLTVSMIFGGSGCFIFLAEAQNTNFSYSYFNTPDDFVMVDDVEHFSDNSSFLMNSRSASMLTSSCGRLLYKDRVRMKDSASGVVASFSTSFTFKITGANTYHYPNYGVVHGDGLAFTFAKANDLKGQDPGSSLCLIKEEENGFASNRLFAVEFDTFENYWWNDPSDSHVGVNVNSMNSTVYRNLCGGKVRNCSYLCNGGYFTAWIDYNSGTQNLDVFFKNGSLYNDVTKPLKPLLNMSLSLQDLLDNYMYVGFSSSTGLFSEVHEIQSWRFTSSGMPEQTPGPGPGPGPGSDSGGRSTDVGSGSSRRSFVGVIAGVSAGAVVAVLLVGSCIALRRRRALAKKPVRFCLVDENLVPREFSYKELSKATKRFSGSELLGTGGFGAVYKGTLTSGAVVAVKRMRNENKNGQESFIAEAASLSQIRHRNLVQLRGWCQEDEQLFLVYDYMVNGSLDDWLYHFSRRQGQRMAPNGLNETDSLSLTLRHSVLSGVAAALAYLHEECAQCVLHRDIKSSNVLLDEDLNAHMGDFGLARLIDHRKMEKTTMLAGTLGYMAPEMPYTGKATKETDVYSFGVLMLEVMCGARPLDMALIERGDGILVDRVWQAHEAGNIFQVADSSLVASASMIVSDGESKDLELRHNLVSNAATEDKTMITSLLRLGLLCCNPNPEGRPSMRMVSQSILQSSETMEMSIPPLPRSKPWSNYGRPGYSELNLRRLTSISGGTGAVISVQDTAASAATTPSPGLSSNGEPASSQSSFIASSAIFSDR